MGTSTDAIALANPVVDRVADVRMGVAGATAVTPAKRAYISGTSDSRPATDAELGARLLLALERLYMTDPEFRAVVDAGAGKRLEVA